MEVANYRDDKDPQGYCQCRACLDNEPDCWQLVEEPTQDPESDGWGYFSL